MRFISYSMYSQAGDTVGNRAKVRLSASLHLAYGGQGRVWNCSCGILMQPPPLDPDVADFAPTDAALTSYDEQHLVTYWRLLDAEADGAEWKEVARIVLHIDPDREPAR